MRKIDLSYRVLGYRRGVDGELIDPPRRCDDAEVMDLWRKAGLPEFFLGNGGTNHKLVTFAKLIRESQEGFPK